jgi:tetratricopeptide (TPR) repeat protein
MMLICVLRKTRSLFMALFEKTVPATLVTRVQAGLLWRMPIVAMLALFPALSDVEAQHHSGPAIEKPAMLLPGMGDLHHPISTTNPEAQKFFDQGLTLVYGFNRPEALRSFKRAAELDPRATMPLWGIALAVAPHINMDGDMDVDQKAGYEAIQKALSISRTAPEAERAYVEALAKRFSNDPKADPQTLARDYAKAMAELVKRYPDDLDAATLYGEGLMVVSRWKWWTPDGKPAEGTAEAVSALESVLRRSPLHPGANHYFLHAVEMSPSPERALPSAARLMGVVPGIGHLVHMPGHIFMQLGDYELSAATNERAVEADKKYIELTGVEPNVYTLGYYSHNIHFVAMGHAAQGRFDDAKRAADDLAANVAPAVKVMPPMADYFMPVQLYVLLRFQRWDEILRSSPPDQQLVFLTTFRHYARAIALAAKGNKEEARKEQRLFEEARKKVPGDAMLQFNTSVAVLKVAAAALEARVAASDTAAIPHWKRAVEAQDSLAYDEPPSWYYPVRESLGGALLRSGQPAEAEAVFREDLKRNPRNGRSLFGLMESLKAQNKTTQAEWVRREFETAWKRAQVQLRIEDL